MSNASNEVYVLNPNADLSRIESFIQERFSKIRALTRTEVKFVLDDEDISNYLWTIGTLSEEIENCFNLHLKKVKPSDNSHEKAVNPKEAV